VSTKTLEERYSELSAQQKVLFSALVNKELADSVLTSVRTLKRIAANSKNDQAATSASRMLLSLAEKRGVLKADPIAEMMDGIMGEFEESPLSS